MRAGETSHRTQRAHNTCLRLHDVGKNNAGCLAAFYFHFILFSFHFQKHSLQTIDCANIQRAALSSASGGVTLCTWSCLCVCLCVMYFVIKIISETSLWFFAKLIADTPYIAYYSGHDGRLVQASFKTADISAILVSLLQWRLPQTVCILKHRVTATIRLAADKHVLM